MQHEQPRTNRPWTIAEIQYMEANASQGAAEISAALGRSIASVKMQASRYGVSLRPRSICSNCGHATHKPLSSKTGWCVACTLEWQSQRALEKTLQALTEQEEEQERIAQAERKRNASYVKLHRARRNAKGGK